MPKYRTVLSFDVGIRNLSYCVLSICDDSTQQSAPSPEKIFIDCDVEMCSTKDEGTIAEPHAKNNKCDDGCGEEYNECNNDSGNDNNGDNDRDNDSDNDSDNDIGDSGNDNNDNNGDNGDNDDNDDNGDDDNCEIEDGNHSPSKATTQSGTGEDNAQTSDAISATLIEDLGRMRVRDWKLVDILTEHKCRSKSVYTVPKSKIILYVVKYLQNHFEFEESDGPVAVHVEDQPRGSDRMKVVSYAIATHFTTTAINNPKLKMDVFWTSGKQKLTLCDALGVPSRKPTRQKKTSSTTSTTTVPSDAADGDKKKSKPSAADKRKAAKRQEYQNNKWRAKQGCPIALRHVQISKTTRSVFEKHSKTDDLADSLLQGISEARKYLPPRPKDAQCASSCAEYSVTKRKTRRVIRASTKHTNKTSGVTAKKQRQQ